MPNMMIHGEIAVIKNLRPSCFLNWPQELETWLRIFFKVFFLFLRIKIQLNFIVSLRSRHNWPQANDARVFLRKAHSELCGVSLKRLFR